MLKIKHIADVVYDKQLSNAAVYRSYNSRKYGFNISENQKLCVHSV